MTTSDLLPPAPDPRRRRILLLITDLEIGGTPTVVREVALRLKHEARIEVACLSQWRPVADQIRDGGLEVTALGARRPTDLHVIRDLIRLIRERQFDTVFSFLIHANTAAAIASRFCGDVRFIQSIQTTQPYPKWHWILQRLVHHAAEAVVVPSPSAARVAQEWADVSGDEIVVIPNAVELMPQRTSHGRGARVTVGFLGRLDPVKRVTDLVAAMSFLDDSYSLSIYGEGEERSRIENEVTQRSLRHRVTLHGRIAKPQAAIETFDVLVLPSEAEGFGLVLIEAMAMGVPVVATDVPGIRDVVRDGVNGLLIPVGKPDQLAGAIRQVVETDSLRQRLIQAGMHEVRRRYDWSVVLPQYRKLLKLDEYG
jgi:glycosyltransferase involved in cell wall biosynthesis